MKLSKRQYINYLCYTMLGLFAAYSTLLGQLINELIKRFGLSLSLGGTVAFISFIGFFTLSIFSMFFSNKIGYRNMLLIGGLATGVLALLLSISQDFITMCILFFFIGGFCGWIETMVICTVAEENPDHPEVYVNFSQVFFCVGAIVMPLTAGILINYGMGISICYTFIGFMLLLSAGSYGIITRGRAAKKDKKFTDFSGLGRLFKDPKFLLIGVTLFLYTSAEMGMVSWMPSIMEKIFSMTPIKISIAVALFWFSMMVGKMIFGKMLLRIGLGRLIFMLGAFSTASLIVFFFVKNEYFIYPIVALLGFSYSSIFSSIISYGASFKKEEDAETVYTAIVGIGSLGPAICPLIMGFIGDGFGIQYAVVFPVICIVIMTIIYFILNNQDQKNQRSE